MPAARGRIARAHCEFSENVKRLFRYQIVSEVVMLTILLTNLGPTTGQMDCPIQMQCTHGEVFKTYRRSNRKVLDYCTMKAPRQIVVSTRHSLAQERTPDRLRDIRVFDLREEWRPPAHRYPCRTKKSRSLVIRLKDIAFRGPSFHFEGNL